MDNHNEKKTKQIKRILAIITIVFVILIGYFIGRPLVHFVSDPKQFRVWVNDKGIWGVLGFIGMNILQVLLAVIPGGPFEIGAGYAFGVIRGTLICDFAMTTASVIIFLFVRRFGMKFVELFVSREKIESVKILKSSRRSESIIFPHTRNSQRPVILSRRTDRHKAFPLDHYLCSWPYAGNLSFCLKRQRIKQSGLRICHSDVCRHDRPVHLRIFLLPLPQ